MHDARVVIIKETLCTCIHMCIEFVAIAVEQLHAVLAILLA